MKKIEVSVIIPTYNRGNLIEETINSVLNQTYQNYEILVIDDGSTDNTKKVVQSINDRRIKYIFQEHTGHPAPTRNTGIKIAKGEYIAFLDSDDLWFPQKLEIQINFLKQNKNISMVSTNGIIILKEGIRNFFPINENLIISFKEQIKTNLVIASSVLIKKNVINNVGLMDENIADFIEDYDYWLRVLRFKDNSILILMKNYLIKYRIHENNISHKTIDSSQKRLRKYQSFKYVISKHFNFNPRFIQNILNQLHYKFRLTIMEKLLFQNKISIFFFLRDQYLSLNTRLYTIIKFIFLNYLNKYFNINKRNFFINYLRRFLKKKVYTITSIKLC